MAQPEDFDETLRAVLAEAESAGSMDAAVDAWLERLDDTFIPDLAARIEGSGAEDDPDAARMSELMAVLQERSQLRFERARDQLYPERCV